MLPVSDDHYEEACIAYVDELNAIYQTFATRVSSGIRKRKETTGIYAHAMAVVLDESDDDELLKGVGLDKVFERAPERDGRPPWLEPLWRQPQLARPHVGRHRRTAHPLPRGAGHAEGGLVAQPDPAGDPERARRLAPMDDDAGGDPREELAFQAQLANYGHTLRQAGGSIKRPWQPGAPPIEWS